MCDVFWLSADRVSSSLVDTITGVFLYRSLIRFCLVLRLDVLGISVAYCLSYLVLPTNIHA